MPGKTIEELDRSFERLHECLLRGELEEHPFKAEVERLGFTDQLGRRWKIGCYTGRWYRHDQGWWYQDTPSQGQAGQQSLAAAGGAKGQRRTSITSWLVAVLVSLLAGAGVLLVADLNADRWGGSSLLAQVSATQGANPSPSMPPAAPTRPPARVPPSPTTPLPSVTPQPTATRRPQGAGQLTPTTPPRSVTATATISGPADTPAPATGEPGRTTSPSALATAATTVPSPTASPSASPAARRTRSASATPWPQPEKASLAGRIFFPVYDPQPARRTFDIYAVRLNGGEREPVAGQASQPAISPDGQRLVHRSWNPDQRGLTVLELADGNTWRWVISAEAARPTWSPNGQSIVFPVQQASDRRWRVYRTIGMEAIQIQRSGVEVFGREPTWLADGRIVYWDCLGGGCGLYLMQSDGTHTVRLTTSEHDKSPAASPNGRSLAFMSSRSGNWEIYVIASDAPASTEPRRLTRNGANDGLPAWSPDGKWLAFVSDRGGVWAVWAIRPDGSGLRWLFDLGGPLDGPVAGAQPTEQTGWTSETIAWGP